MEFIKNLDITRYTLSGIPGEGLLFSYKAESFFIVFIITAAVFSLNVVISSLIGDYLNNSKYKNKKIKYLLHFIFTWLHIFFTFFILYQLIGWGHQDLGPCQKVVGNKICRDGSLTKKLLSKSRFVN